jgi:hypothetical protein
LRPRLRLEAAASALAAFDRSARHGVEAMDKLRDAASADILTEIVRGIEMAVVR